MTLSRFTGLIMELENIVANTVYIKAREGQLNSLVSVIRQFNYHCHYNVKLACYMFLKDKIPSCLLWHKS